MLLKITYFYFKLDIFLLLQTRTIDGSSSLDKLDIDVNFAFNSNLIILSL